MPLSWNEIRKRAIEFSHEWEGTASESAEKQSFYNDFFSVFGITRKRVVTFEKAVKKINDNKGFIDVFWPSLLLVEHKSLGQNLESASLQAFDYFHGLKEEDLPRYVLVSDFSRFRLYDLEADKDYKFGLKELPDHIHLFGFIAGYQKREFKDQDPVNIKASERMGTLHDMLKDAGYSGHVLEIYLVRLLFCLFADDTGIFEKDLFRYYIEERTKEDGSDLGQHLALLFQVLDTARDKRQKTLDESLAEFEYINGSLFSETLPIANFNSDMRAALISACNFDWSRISPAIFGSLFQSVMDKDKRRGVGAHYTTEMNIMKILKPLFLDELYDEFEKTKTNRAKLLAFHDKLAALRFLDPACGCGNFLILTYRELRLLEIEVLKRIHKDMLDKLKGGAAEMNIASFSRIDVDAFHGFEIEEFPARIAEVALWLMDHQMNIRLSDAFGVYYARLPLKKSAHIVHDNALRLDWQQEVPKEQLSYILGNPPFIAKHLMTEEQGKEVDAIFHGVNGAGILDYVTAWYLKAAQYIQGSHIKCAFVSTNSISQGEQVGILWQELFNRYHIKIHFAHKTFAWGSEARGKAAVHCVIIGFAAFDTDTKLLYDYDTSKSEAHEIQVRNINPYLIEADDFVILKRSSPICYVPEMSFGSKPVDDGNFFFTDDEKAEFLKNEPLAKKYLRPVLSAKEYLNNENRWCLWLKNADPSELRKMPLVMERIEKVKVFRLASKKMPTREAAAYPSLWTEVRQPKSNFVIIPLHTSENRKYIPFGFFDQNHIVHGSCSCLPNASPYHFGILTSAMHMAWVKYICGRIKSDYRYSNTLVYNNFPWPSPTEAQTKDIEAKGQAVLDARAQFPDSSLADLYDPLSMPPALLKVHQALDKAVDAAYRKQPFDSERHRIEYLFALYQQITAPLIAPAKKKGRKS